MKRGGKATHEQLREHNLHLLLRAVYSGVANNRAALAQHTGLAKPTVSELVSELIRLGLLAEGGHGQSGESGGKRPRLLEFVPTARQVIGVSVDSYQVSGVLANLDGALVARHVADLEGAQEQDALDVLRQVINALIAQLDAPLLCLGVGVPGVVDAEQGIVRSSPHLLWRELPLSERLQEAYGAPVYTANSTELAAMAQYTYDTDETVRNLVTILINHNIEIGIALGGAVYHHGSDIGCLRLDPATGEGSLEAYLTAPAIKRRAQELAQQFPGSVLAGSSLSYLDMRRAEQLGDEAARQLYDELGSHLARVCAWVIALLRPDHITIAGPVKTLGEPLIERVRAQVASLLPLDSAGQVSYSLADSASLSAVGAVANALQRELGIW